MQYLTAFGKYRKEERRKKTLGPMIHAATLNILNIHLLLLSPLFLIHFYIVSVILDIQFFILFLLFYCINLHSQFLNLLITVFDDSEIFHQGKYHHLPKNLFLIFFQ